MNQTPQPLPVIYLYSFGFKYSGIPKDSHGHGGGFVFDCRSLPNPFWEEPLRPFAGDEPPIVAFMESKPQVAEYARHAQAMVLAAAREFRASSRERMMVSFGCTGGRHRSVYQAAVMKTVLEKEGFAVRLEHLDRDRPEEKLHRPPPAS